MADPTTITALTNNPRDTCVDVQCDCNTIWSMAQQFSTKRLCNITGKLKGALVTDFEVRARRIAATYARFYLETEDGGNSKFIGRFYWMALGAFASKTVACTFRAWQVRALTLSMSPVIWDGLGKGNFWLFCDISGWHWYYSNHKESFDQCLLSRDASKYVKQVKLQMDALPWKKEALEKMSNLKVSSKIKEGFAKVKKFEAESDNLLLPSIQFEHLLDIADHEQGVILQPLIYDGCAFALLVGAQRASSWVSPTLELVFTHACASTEPKMKSVAPDDMKLEDFRSRMKWIRQAALTFHNLMQLQTKRMEYELQQIAGWVDMQDNVKVESYMAARAF
ncbi:MAG: hypothetical protein V4857_20250 [Pseudomonadota bacterium]